MPYEWVDDTSAAAELHAWPYRSLPRRGFVGFILASVGIAAIPLSAIVGTVVLWCVLPFFVLTFWALWHAIDRSYRDGEILETLRLWPERMTLSHETRKCRRDWEANPHWVRPELHRGEQPVENYLTLRGGPRDVELGAFLTPDERKAIYEELNLKMAELCAPDP